MALTDRLNGVNVSLALKAPVRVRTTANITLFGIQTIDGVVLEENDRVLVMAQTTGYENGIYKVGTGQWTRASDWDGLYDITKGTMVKVQEGTSYAGYWYEVTNDDPVVGTTAITFADSTSAVAAAAAASGYADAAEASAIAAAASEAGVASDAADAEAARAAAVIAKDAAVVAKTAAETAETNAETAETNAEAAQAAAEAQVALATTQANNASASAAAAQTAETNAETAQSGAEAAQAAAEAAAAALRGTSTSNVTIGTGAKSFTTQAGKQFSAGGFLMITSDADPTNDYMFGQITSYVGTALDVNVIAVSGNGEAHSDWTINVAGHRGATGAQGPQGDPGADGADGVDGDDAYFYIAWADNVNGDGFTMTFSTDKEYLALKSTTAPLSPPVQSDFNGLWFSRGGPQGETGPQGIQGNPGVDGDDAYVYIAYASAADGTDFTTVFNSALDYIAVKTTTTPLSPPVVGDFAGLWKNYKGATGAQGPQGDPGGSLTYFTDLNVTAIPNATIEFIGLDFIGTAPYDGGFDFKGYDSGTSTGGAFSLQIPDNTAAGGNKRGAGAIELQSYRSVAANVASGTESVAIGNDTKASGSESIALGAGASAVGTSGISIGRASYAETNYSICIGDSSSAAGASAIAIGWDSSASANSAVAMGLFAVADGGWSVAIGVSSYAPGEDSVAIGDSSESGGPWSVAIGFNAGASSDNAVALGNSALAVPVHSVAIGQSSFVPTGATSAVAIGDGSAARHADSVAIGAGPQARGVGAIAIGDAATTGKSTGVNTGQGAIAIGDGALANTVTDSTTNAIAIGAAVTSQGNGSVALGFNADATANATVAIGTGADASATSAVAIGDGAAAWVAGATAVGGGAFANAGSAVAIGSSPQVSGASAIGIGAVAEAVGVSSIAIGDASYAGNDYSIAIGAAASTDAAYSIAIGTALTRGIQGNFVVNPAGGQFEKIALIKTTNDATQGALTSNNSAASTDNQVIMPDDSAFLISGMVVARDVVSGDTKAWTFKAFSKRGTGAASASLLAAVTPDVVAADAGASSWALAIEADTTNGGVAVKATGEVDTIIQWKAVIDVVPVASGI